MEEDSAGFFWVRSDGENRLATENLVPGNRVYREKLVYKKRTEYRLWDPFRSKLAAAIMIGLEEFPFKNKTTVLYLGVSSGTTISHISDIVGPSGIIFGVEHASRPARDFIDRVVKYRRNIIPVLQDARRPREYSAVFGKVDVIYADIAQKDQTEIAIANCRTYLKKNGHLFLVIKTRSINAVKSTGVIVEEETDKLRKSFEIIQNINLYPYDKDHAIVLARAR